MHMPRRRRIEMTERRRCETAYSDLELLARLIQCEAGGEGTDGMKAVAGVVMNRVRIQRGEYARVGRGSLRNIVFQKGQFQCVNDFAAQSIYNMAPTGVHYEIAKWAFAGNRLTDLGEALWFFNPFSPSCPGNFPGRVGRFAARIGKHCFYVPTAAYDET